LYVVATYCPCDEGPPRVAVHWMYTQSHLEDAEIALLWSIYQYIKVGTGSDLHSLRWGHSLFVSRRAESHGISTEQYITNGEGLFVSSDDSPFV